MLLDDGAAAAVAAEAHAAAACVQLYPNRRLEALYDELPPADLEEQLVQVLPQLQRTPWASACR
jgi:hypothetical protein